MKALPNLPSNTYQSRTELESAVKELGDITRERKRLETATNDQIARLQEELAKAIEPMDAKIKHIASGIKFYCDTNREEMFGKEKTVELLTGVVAYRTQPPSVSSKSSKKLVDTLVAKSKTLATFNKIIARLSKFFLRVKVDLNKEAILANPKAAKKLGIKIKEGKERFYVKPTEVDTEFEVKAA